MSVLLGPADADHFRVKVGRYNDRWYCDPLPTDEVAEASDAAWPSFSSVKKASGNDWSYVAMNRIARADTDELMRLAQQPVAKRYDACKSINNYGLSVAGGRGTIVHWWGEDLLHGREPRDITELDLMGRKIPAASLIEARRYLPALRAFFDAFQPELVATEYVAIHRDLNGVGYGCTPDGQWLIDGERSAYDFKSRGEDSDHGAYPEEAAQIAAGTKAQYMVVEGEHGAERRRLPDVTCGMVVSIKPDGCRVYPVDLDKAFSHYEAMHAWWCARRAEREPVGKPWAPRKNAQESGKPTAQVPTTPAPNHTVLIDRTRALVDAGHGLRLSYVWPEGVPGFKTDHEHTADELAAIMVAVRQVEDEQSIPWHPADDTSEPVAPTPLPERTVDATLPVSIDEGERLDDTTYEVLKQRHAALTDTAHLMQLSAEANAVGVGFSLARQQTVRRWNIVRALVLWTEYGWDEAVVRDLLGQVLNSDQPRHPATPLGAVIGALTIDEANRFAELGQAALDGAPLEANNGRWQLAGV